MRGVHLSPACALALALCSACGEPETGSQTLDPSGAADGGTGDGGNSLTMPDDLDEVSDEDLAKRQLQLKIRVQPSQGSVQEVDADELALSIREDCISLLKQDDSLVHNECSDLTVDPVKPGVGACEAQLCHTQLHLCTAHRLMEAASTVTPLELSGGELKVLPQSTASNAAISERAIKAARDTLLAAGGALLGLSEQPTMNTINGCSPSDAGITIGTGADQQTYAASFAATFAESYQLLWEASEAAAKANVAAAEEAWSRYPSRRKAAYFAQTAPVLSRAHAAQLLLGGPAEGGLVAFQDDEGKPLPIAEVEEPSPAGAVAVDLLRASGIDPDLVNGQPVDQLLVAKNGDSVHLRLAQVFGEPSLEAKTPEEIADHFGLKLVDFVEAQQFMKAQNLAFGRSRTATLPPLPPQSLPGGGEGQIVPYPRYAATATAPTPSSSSFFAELIQRTTVAFDDRDPASLESAEPLVRPIRPVYVDRGAAQTVDHALTVASTVLGNPDVHADTAAILSPLVVQGIRQRPYRMQVCSERFLSPARTEYQFKVFAQDSAAAQQVRLVRGRDGLECATRGKIDGASCDLAQYVETVPQVVTVPTKATGFSHAAALKVTGQAPRFFAVRPKVAGTAANQEGAFEAIVGFTPPADLTPAVAGVKYCTLIPAVPEMIDLAGQTIKPSPTSPSESEQTCAGLPLTQRIPLEDELTDDGDAYESSWRHYLNLARQASAEADALGEELIARGLEMDMRAESALEEVEQLCGSAVNVEDLIRPDLADAVAGDCTTQDQCSPGYVCSVGKCRKDAFNTAVGQAVLSADASRLSECLGDGNVLPFVALGSTPLCLWHAEGDPTKVCEGATADNPCPYEADEADGVVTCPAPKEVVAGTTIVPVPDRLNLFVSDGQTLGGMGAPCDDLRIVRERNPLTDPVAKLALKRVRDSNYFDPVHVRQLAQNLNWEPRIGSYVAVKAYGRDLVSTGDLRSEPLPYWPCKDDRFPGTPQIVCAENSPSLFCAEPVQCGANDPAEKRVLLNQRLAEAVFAARISSGVYLHQFPFVEMSDEAEMIAASEYGTYHGAAIRAGKVGRYGPKGAQAFCRTDPATEQNAGWHTVDGSGNITAVTAKCGYPYSNKLFILVPYARASDGFLTGGPNMFASSAIWSGLGARRRGTWGGVGPLVEGSLLRDGPLHQVVLGPYDVDGAVTVTNSPVMRFLGAWYYDDDYTKEEDRPLAPKGITRGQLLDAAELLCEMGRTSTVACDLSKPPVISAPSDLESLRNYINCAAANLEQRAQLSAFANVPAQVVQALQASAPNGAYPQLGGAYAEKVAALRVSLLDMSSLPVDVARQLRMFSNDLQILQMGMQRLAGRKSIAEIQFLSQSAAQLAQAAHQFNGFQGLLATAYAAVEIARAAQIRDLTKEDIDLEEEQELLQFQNRFETYASTLSDYAERLRMGVEQVDASLAALETQRRMGLSALARATFADSDQAGKNYHVNTVMRRRQNTLMHRYAEARDSAIRLTFLAKRAIEMRIGMKLKDLTEPMSLVSAPRTWEAGLCTMSGLDYARIRDESDLLSDNYADGYIGDYVDKLERVVESYLLDFPSHAASDVSVLSLRDELQNIRSTCLADVNNRLLHASQLDYAGSDEGANVWSANGCATVPVPDEATPCTAACTLGCAGEFCAADEDQNGVADVMSPNCVNALPTSELPYDTLHTAFGVPRVYELTFGTDVAGVPVTFVAGQSDWGQNVALAPGRYRLSYYADSSTAASLVVAVTPADKPDEDLIQQFVFDDLDATMTRYWGIFDLALPTNVRVRFGYQAAGGGVVRLAAPMLEQVTNKVKGDAPDAADWPPPDFADTGDASEHMLPVCEDTSGEIFRVSSWVRDCVQSCADGFAQSCDEGAGRIACFWETQFAVSQSDIENGRIIHGGGFASGNYDYRIESLALNFVGTATRDCEDSNLPSTCHAAAYVPYSIEHRGPYEIRNHLGEDFDAPIYTGRIEHARGLAAERYLTNPLSSADSSLIQSYVRHEFRGRPLHGTFVVRVWDEEGVNFDGIRDVQILLNYRYRTRFE